MASKVYMVNNNAEFETTMAVIEIDDNDIAAVQSFISKLNAESKPQRRTNHCYFRI